jgi:hypothetical protein
MLAKLDIAVGRYKYLFSESKITYHTTYTYNQECGEVSSEGELR